MGTSGFASHARSDSSSAGESDGEVNAVRGLLRCRHAKGPRVGVGADAALDVHGATAAVGTMPATGSSVMTTSSRDSRCRLDLARGGERQQLVAESPELECIADLVDRRRVAARVLHVRNGHVDVQVRQQVVELPVELDLVEMRSQALPRLARHVVGGLEDPREPAVRVDPLSGGLWPDAGHAWQVVARLPNEGGEVRVLLGPSPRSAPPQRRACSCTRSETPLRGYNSVTSSLTS